MKEPSRHSDLDSLTPDMQIRVRTMFQRMVNRHFDPVIFESYRTDDRQLWLYGVGRTHSFHRRPVTWTKRSKHRKRIAVDVISKKRGWGWPAFYVALHQEARKVGLHPINKEQCHIEL